MSYFLFLLQPKILPTIIPRKKANKKVLVIQKVNMFYSPKNSFKLSMTSSIVSNSQQTLGSSTSAP